MKDYFEFRQELVEMEYQTDKSKIIRDVEKMWNANEPDFRKAHMNAAEIDLDDPDLLPYYKKGRLGRGGSNQIDWKRLAKDDWSEVQFYYDLLHSTYYWED